MHGLNSTAVVYTPHATTGAYTVVANAGLTCRLANKGQAGQGAAEERDELVQNRRLLWRTAYTMPNDAQIEVEGVRWNVIPNSYSELKGLGSAVRYRRCDLTVVS